MDCGIICVVLRKIYYMEYSLLRSVGGRVYVATEEKMTREDAVKALELALETQLRREADLGMVDLKCLCEIDRDSSTLRYAWTLNNALKHRELAKPVAVADLDF